MLPLAPSLNNLPVEISLMILENIPQADRPNVARVCCVLRDLVIPLLYRALYFAGPNDCFVGENDPKRHLRSRIFNTNLFYRTLEESPSLASTIEKATFEGSNYPKGAQGNDNEIMAALPKVLPLSLQRLHLQLRLPPCPSVAALVTSLEVNTRSYHLDREKLYSLFCLPRLERLILSDWNYSFIELVSLEAGPVDRMFTSNVTSLSFHANFPISKDNFDLFFWVKKLKSLQVWMEGPDFPALFAYHDRYIDTSTIIGKLQPHAKHLEELYLSGPNITFENPVDLTNFTSLRRLGLPRGDLMNPKISPKLRDVLMLPPGLEVLRIDLPVHRSWSSYLGYPTSADGDALVESGDEIVTWLCDIALNVSEYRGLKKLVIGFRDGNFEDYDLYSDPKARNLLSVFGKAGTSLVLEREHSYYPFGEV